MTDKDFFDFFDLILSNQIHILKGINMRFEKLEKEIKELNIRMNIFYKISLNNIEKITEIKMKNKETCKWTYDCVNYYFPECQSFVENKEKLSSQKYELDKFC